LKYAIEEVDSSALIAYRGLISATNSDTEESEPVVSKNPAGISEAEALFVTPLGHSLVK
jgi:hypothetical protein